MYERIVVPLDGSPFSERALPIALTVARHSGASVELVHVREPLQPDPRAWMPYPAAHVEQWQREATEADERYLSELAARIAAGSGPPPTWKLIRGQPVAAIKDLVRRSRADLLVMSTHGRGGIARAWIGSVADRLLRELTIPMLLIRPGEEATEPSAEVPLHRILIPLDGSELAEAALEPALELGTAVGARYTLLSVVVPFFPPGSFALASPAPELAELGPLVERAEEYLHDIAERLRAEALEVETDVVTHMSPGAAILEFAAERGTELIAVSTHGRGGLTRLVLGSVADKLIRGAGVPVLVLRPGGVRPPRIAR